MTFESFISAFFRARFVIVAVAWSLGAAGFYLLMDRGLREEFTLESLVESGDPDYLIIEAFLEKFISSELGIVAVTMDDPLSEQGLALFSQIDAEIRAIEHIDQAQSILSVPYIEGGGGTLGAILSAAGSILHPDLATDDISYTVALCGGGGGLMMIDPWPGTQPQQVPPPDTLAAAHRSRNFKAVAVFWRGYS